MIQWLSDYKRGLDWELDLQVLQIVTTSNYSASVNSHTVQLTTARTKSSHN
jgi:hypothetical protein